MGVSTDVSGQGANVGTQSAEEIIGSGISASGSGASFFNNRAQGISYEQLDSQNNDQNMGNDDRVEVHSMEGSVGAMITRN